MLSETSKFRLREIRDLILAEPAPINMTDWHTTVSAVMPACGTIGCIAGWAVACCWAEDRTAVSDTERFSGVLNGYSGEFLDDAAAWLSLDSDEVRRLFYSLYWPAQFTADFVVSAEGGQIPG